MSNCNTSMLVLTIQSLQFNECDTCQLNVNINNCIFGTWVLEGIANISVTNCSIVNSHDDKTKTLLSISNSYALIENIRIEKLTCNKSLNVQSGSYVLVRLSEFIKNDAEYGLIHVNDNSSLIMEKCHLWKNNALYEGGAIYISNSFTQVENTNFEDNSAAAGGAIYIQNQSILQVTNSNFTQNKANSGGAIYGKNSVKLDVVNTEFGSNVANKLKSFSPSGIIPETQGKTSLHLAMNAISDRPPINVSAQDFEPTGNSQWNGGAILCRQYCTVLLYKSTFTGNYATTFGGGVTAYGHSTLDLLNVTFSRNKVDGAGGAIFAQKYCNVKVEKSLFSGNIAFFNAGRKHFGIGGGICASVYSTVDVNTSEFYNNSASNSGAAVFILIYSVLNISYTAFNLNWAPQRGGGIYVQDNSTVIVRYCSFANNTVEMFDGGAISASFYSTLNVSHTIFSMNEAGGRGSAIGIFGHCNVTVHNCSLTNNFNGSVSCRRFFQSRN